ncbi:MAG: N-acetyltransferase [Acidimicrobiales bacterium]
MLAFARASGYSRVSLETGTQDEFVPARTLYGGIGFTPCDAFGDYRPSPYNTFMTLVIAGEEDPAPLS